MLTRFSPLWPQGRAPVLCDEAARLSVLAAHGVDALVDDPELAAITAFAARLCEAPIALVTMVESERQRFLARHGLAATETPRPTSFCAHAMLGAEPLVVADARADARFADNPLVTGAPHIRFYAGQPLVSAEGAPLGALCIIDTLPRTGGLTALQAQGLAVLADAVKRRLSQQRLGIAAESAVESRESQLKTMIDTVPGIAFSADDQGNFDYFNARWTEMTGAPALKAAAEWTAFVHRDDIEGSRQRWAQAVAARDTYEDRWRLRRADGEWRWILARVVPARDAEGVVRWFGALIDIDEAQREAEARELIAQELSHRIKNIFAVIAGLVALHARGRPDVADFAADLGAAVRALGIAHDHIQPNAPLRRDSLRPLLAELLAPYDAGQGARIAIRGDDVRLGARAATPLALIFHELATNAAKYGALSGPDGRVEVTVVAPCGDADEADATVCVDWHESGGPVPAAPAGQEGFGSRLLRMAIEGQLGGRCERVMAADGLRVRIEVPAARLAAN